MASRERILLITRNFPPAHGGIETMAFELARHAAANGVELTVVHFGQEPCNRPPAGIAYRHLPGSGRWSALAISLLAIPFLAFRCRPRVVVNMQVTTSPGSLLAALLLRVPYIVMGHGLEMLPPRRFPAAFSWRGPALRGAHRVISNSRFTDSLAARFGVSAGRRRVINPGTRRFPAPARDPAAAFGPLPPDPDRPFICLSLTRLVPRKGIDMALEAIAQVLRRRTDILYCVGGGGPDLGRLQALAAEKGIRDHVRFLGRLPDEKLGLCYASADLFVLPSRTSGNPPDAEGFGIVFLEAAACGTPSLGGKSGGIPDAIDNGVTGFLVDPLDPTAMAEKILLLMEDRERLRAMGESALARALASTWERSAEVYWSAILS